MGRKWHGNYFWRKRDKEKKKEIYALLSVYEERCLEMKNKVARKEKNLNVHRGVNVKK